jgi:periplasmic protein TonB
MKSVVTDWIPGVEKELVHGSNWKSLVFSLVVTLGLFCLIPLSEFVRSQEWLVREVQASEITPPPPPKTEMEKQIEKQALREPVTPKLAQAPVELEVDPLDVTLNVGPGDFKAAFSLANYNPAPDGFGQELIFALHELDRTPNIVKRGSLAYPPQLKRKGLEGEVKLLVLIDEKGTVRVIDVVSATHPDFVEPSRKAAENSIYEPPKRNGEAVKVQFYLPIRFSLID